MKPSVLVSKHLTFEALDYFMRHRKQEITPVFRTRIDLARETCEDIIQGLTSLMGEHEAYFLVNDSSRQLLMQVYGGGFEFSRKELEGARTRFQETIKRLGNLEQDQKAYYEDVDEREMLIHVCRKMKDYYAKELLSR